jgi:hypothetical protein
MKLFLLFTLLCVQLLGSKHVDAVFSFPNLPNPFLIPCKEYYVDKPYSTVTYPTCVAHTYYVPEVVGATPVVCPIYWGTEIRADRTTEMKDCNTPENCCTGKYCSGHMGCTNGMKSNAATLKCTNNVCTTTQCCNSVPPKYCSVQTGCSNSLRPDAATVQCTNNVCGSSQCCSKVPIKYCDEHTGVCPNGLIAGAASVLCTNKVCSTGQCCSTVPLIPTCPADFVCDGSRLKNAVAGADCAGATQTCTQAHCCARLRGTCAAEECPITHNKLGLDQQAAYCAGIDCDVLECCELKPIVLDKCGSHTCVVPMIVRLANYTTDCAVEGCDDITCGCTVTQQCNEYVCLGTDVRNEKTVSMHSFSSVMCLCLFSNRALI